VAFYRKYGFTRASISSCLAPTRRPTGCSPGRSNGRLAGARGRAKWPTRVLRHAADLITSLEEAQAAGRLHGRLKILTHPALFVVDEIGYLPISRTGAMLFFQLMTRRYERASTVLTSSKGF
jgi:hypothetical protein